MLRDEIIEMARQAGIGWGEGIGGMPEFLEAFAKLVAAKQQARVEMLEMEITALEEKVRDLRDRFIAVQLEQEVRDGER